MSLTYCIITPAYNEERFIGNTIKSVINQTYLPLKWIIVNDGSTDRTNQIVKKSIAKFDWIELIELSENLDRNFASKIYAFNKGYDKLEGINYDIICCLDADITFGQDYFEYLLDKFEKDANLGVAGTGYIEGNFHSFRDSYSDVRFVNGGCQLFRKRCFENIGGYIPIKGGGVDWVAVTTARMKGWKTWSFSDRVFFHHRRVGTANTSIYRSRYNFGKKDYFLGSHPLWEIFRGVFQITKRPYIIGGIFLLIGYFISMIKRSERPISKELMKFTRKEQMDRLRHLLVKGFKKDLLLHKLR